MPHATLRAHDEPTPRIGAASALGFARANAGKVIIHYNSFPEGAEEIANQVRAAGAEAQTIQADLSTEAGIYSLISQLGSSPEIDILVNNAGALIKRSGIVDYPEPLYDGIMNLNVKSLWFVTKACVPHMIAKKEGVIVNVSSIAARNGGGPGATIYAAAKAAVSAITKGLSKELAPKGIRVNAISPGTVDNHFHEVFSTREVLDSVVKMTPAGRLGTNEEMADSVLFLSSPAAAYIHGQTIEINGGGYMI